MMHEGAVRVMAEGASGRVLPVPDKEEVVTEETSTRTPCRSDTTAESL